MVRHILFCLFAVFLAALPPAPSSTAAARYDSYAIVQENGSLRVSGRTLWLYGINIPPTYETCLTYIEPVRCGPKAILELDRKIGPHFVHCDAISENEDGSINALCLVEGEDLSAWMLREGWAEALPDAPAQYHRLERMARESHVGIWSILPPGDVIIQRPRGRPVK